MRIMKIAAHSPKTIITFSVLTSKILPNKNEKISIENPPDKLIRTIPIAIHDESKIAIIASPEISNFCRIFVNANALRIETTYAAHNG